MVVSRLTCNLTFGPQVSTWSWSYISSYTAFQYRVLAGATLLSKPPVTSVYGYCYTSKSLLQLSRVHKKKIEYLYSMSGMRYGRGNLFPSRGNQIIKSLVKMYSTFKCVRLVTFPIALCAYAHVCMCVYVCVCVYAQHHAKITHTHTLSLSLSLSLYIHTHMSILSLAFSLSLALSLSVVQHSACKGPSLSLFLSLSPPRPLHLCVPFSPPPPYEGVLSLKERGWN